MVSHSLCGTNEKVLAIMFLLVLLAFVAYIVYKLRDMFNPGDVPEIEETWWGCEEPQFVKTGIRPFTITISDEELKDLKWRLDHHRPLTPPLEGIQQQYGMNTDLLKEIVDYWRTDYDWKKREAFLNKFPQFMINIQGLDIHYLHVKPKSTSGVKVLPLLLLHGWPGSVREFYDIIPILTAPQNGKSFVFEVIAPHIPGYGFSQAASKPGLGPAQMALVFKNLMSQLGFKKFYAQGGDFGSTILHNLAVLYPDSLLGLHSNMCVAYNAKSYVMHLVSAVVPWLSWCYVKPEHYDRVFPLKGQFFKVIRESGYFHLQATKPDTVGVGLNDSPIGLAAYILEKFITGTNIRWQKRKDGGLKEFYTYDDLLDNIMIYWWTKSATTSVRLYAETFKKNQAKLKIQQHKILVPSACARFRNDFYTSDGILRDRYPNLVQLSDYEGGHFAAMQLPQVLADDVFEAVEKFERKAKSD